MDNRSDKTVIFEVSEVGRVVSDINLNYCDFEKQNF